MDFQIILVVICFCVFLCIVILQYAAFVRLRRKNKKISDQLEAYQEMYDGLKRRKKAEQEETSYLLGLFLECGNKELIGYYFYDLEKRRQDILAKGGSFYCLGAIEQIQKEAKAKNKNLDMEQFLQSII